MNAAKIDLHLHLDGSLYLPWAWKTAVKQKKALKADPCGCGFKSCFISQATGRADMLVRMCYHTVTSTASYDAVS